MTSATKPSYVVTSRYAIALIELAQDSGSVEAIEKDLESLLEMLKDSEDFRSFVQAPSRNSSQQSEAMNAIAEKAKFNQLTQNFLNVLVHNRRLYALEGIIGAVKEQLARQRGQVSVEVQTVQDLSAAQKKSLQDAIAKGIGKEVSLKAKVEPDILGGMIVTVGSQMIDDSVARKLERMKAAMTRRSNENINPQQKQA